MSKAVLISIRPEWVELIANEQKTIEIRKTRPQIPTPFKCYIYCTMGGDALYSVNGKVQPCNSFELDLKQSNSIAELNGYVVGEFVCDGIQWNCGSDLIVKEDRESALQGSCLRREELFSYLGITPGTSVFDKRCEFYGWHISALKIYDKPKELSEFMQCHKCKYNSGCKEHEYSCDGAYKVTRPPQSYMYVEELAT